MKAGREHRVPLSPAALALLRSLPRWPENPLVFAAPRGGVLSDMTLATVLRRMKLAAVPHGFRSTFRDWAAECTHFPRAVAEMALAYAIGDKVEAACRRGDLFEKRRRLMDNWAAFLDSAKSGTVHERAAPDHHPGLALLALPPAGRLSLIQWASHFAEWQ